MGDRTQYTEPDRLNALRSYNVMDSAAEPMFDSLISVAAAVCGTPMAILTLIDERRQWFKARIGLDVAETPRDIAFCNHTIEDEAVFEVQDAHLDERFCANPLVLGPPFISFYAGAPLVTPEGHALGSLAVLDTRPRKLQPHERETLLQLSRHAMLLLELRRIGWEYAERSRVLVEASPLPIITVDREARVTFWNRAAEKLFGWRPSEILGQENPIVPRDQFPNYRAMLEEVFSQQRLVEQEAKRTKRDGTVLDVYVSAAPVCAEKGDVVAAMAILQDITAHHRADERLQQSLSLLAATLESTADGMLVVDREGNIIARNRRFAEIWRIPDNVLSTERDSDALAAALSQLKDPAAFLDKVHQLYDRPEMNSFDVLELIDGRILERYSQPQQVNDQIVGRVWSFRDVTERVELESHLRQSQKMEAVGALAGGVAHDFNNLLNIIIGYNSLMAAELKPDQPLAEYADKIKHAADRAASLTRQLLAFSRRQVLRPQVLNVNDIVGDLAQMVPRLLREDIEFKLSLHTGEPPLLVHADPGQIDQVLMNLIVNARDAMPNGGELHIQTHLVTDASNETKRSAEVVVADTGEGIDPTVLPRIFEPFFTTKPTGRGTGLGLSTAFGIIEQSGGTLSVSSELGHGTTFSIRLPLLENASVKPMPSSGQQLAQGRGEVVLVVEDEVALRTLLAQILKGAGYKVAEADSPEHALEWIAQPETVIDLLLTDVIMPRLSGSQLAKRALELRPSLKVAFMSGYPEQDVELRCGNAILIEKPFQPQALIQHVRNILDSAGGSARKSA